MTAKELYEQDGQTGGTQTGALALVNILGQSKYLTGGVTGFMGKTLIVACASATVFGLSAAFACGTIFGPSLPFMGGAAMGFLGGLYHRWTTDTRLAFMLFREYPELMAYHLRYTDMSFYEVQTAEDCRVWSADLSRNLRKQGYAVSAMYSALDALYRIRQDREDTIINKIIADRQQQADAE